MKRAGAKAGSGDDARVATISTLAREHGVLITGDDMYAEIRKTSNPDRCGLIKAQLFSFTTVKCHALGYRTKRSKLVCELDADTAQIVLKLHIFY